MLKSGIKFLKFLLSTNTLQRVEPHRTTQKSAPEEIPALIAKEPSCPFSIVETPETNLEAWLKIQETAEFYF